ncbi:hypothetical protein [Actinomycetospora sp. NBRC 106378]|uniref:glycan biosynthesis hexose transferase WsfD n=1 Tax=Actinomycetospora sp. NBRC 106378 TaxID=3032208 RepID=UPI0024A5A2B2|nr:hypothetical protein [Actinomycetospora sp. NBRC 106378]GLZ55280.1 hypothetical protein Acsp07_48970 [Actinomycetospora sp. NBRC 106378]
MIAESVSYGRRIDLTTLPARARRGTGLRSAASDLRDAAATVPRAVVVPVALGCSTAFATVLALALRIGLVTLPGLGGGLIGVGDNGDAFRLFCTAGLTPDTPSRVALWRGVVVTAFTTGAAPCTAAPSSASLLLRLVVPGGPGTFSLTTYAWLFAGLAAAVVGIGAATLATVRPWRVALVVVPLVGLLGVSWWTRFLVSLYAEPTALVATVAVLVGLLVVAGTRPDHRRQRLVALGLVGVGGLVGATAKPGFVPIGLVAAGCAALVVVRSARGRAGRVWRLAGPLVAVALLAGAAYPVSAAVEGQERTYATVNAHNLIFTAAMPEIGPDVVASAVGLPPGAAAHSGEGYYWAGGIGIPGWATAVGDRPDAARAEARTLLLEHPGAVATMVGRGLTATLRPQLTYLPSAPFGTAPEHFEGRTVYPEAGPQTSLLVRWLDAIPLGWLPLALVVVALGAAAVTVLPRVHRADPLVVGLVRVAGATALLGLAIVTLAVLGDGYYELSKHVWLGSYLFLTAGVSGLAALALGATARFRRPG